MVDATKNRSGIGDEPEISNESSNIGPAQHVQSIQDQIEKHNFLAKSEEKVGAGIADTVCSQTIIGEEMSVVAGSLPLLLNRKILKQFGAVWDLNESWIHFRKLDIRANKIWKQRSAVNWMPNSTTSNKNLQVVYESQNSTNNWKSLIWSRRIYVFEQFGINRSKRAYL